jgi:anaerobic ribonucleoside-triphosphate reductase
MLVIKRNGSKVQFDSYKITIAILSAFNETKEGNHEIAQKLTQLIVNKFNNEETHVEKIQDIVEETLMQEGFLKTAKAYILYREEHKQQREFENDLMKSIAKLSKETNRDNANIGHSPASKMYQIGGTASKAFYKSRLLPKHLAKLQIDGDIHIHDFDYYDKTFNCLSIPLTKMLQNTLDYEFEYGSVRSPKRIESAMSLASIILQRISNDIFGGTMFPNIDMTVQKLVDEGNIEPPDDIAIERSVQSLLYNLATMATRAGNQIPFSSITFGLEQGEYGRKFTKALLNEFNNGMGSGETFIFPNLIYKCLKGVSWQGSPNDDLYDLAVKVSCRRMNPTFNFLDCEYYKQYDPVEVNVMGCRTHVIGNVNGDSISEGRGNIFPTTINLPRIALKTKGTIGNKDIKDFFKKLDKMLENVKELSIHI